MSLVDYEFDSDNEEAGVLLNAAATTKAPPTVHSGGQAALDDQSVYSRGCSPPSGHPGTNNNDIVCTGGTNGTTNTQTVVVRRSSDSNTSTPSSELLLANGSREFVQMPGSCNTGGDNINTNNTSKIDTSDAKGDNTGTTGSSTGVAQRTGAGITTTNRNLHDDWAGCVLESAAQLNEVKSSILTKSNDTRINVTGSGTGTNGNNLSSWSSSLLPGFLEESQYMDEGDSGGAVPLSSGATVIKDNEEDVSCGPRAELKNRLLNKLSLVDHEDETELCRALCNPYLMETIMKRYGVEPHKTHFQDRFANVKQIAKERGDFDQFLAGSLGRTLKHRKQHTGTPTGATYTGNSRMLDSALVNGVTSCNVDSGTVDGTDTVRTRLRKSKWDDPAPSRLTEINVDTTNDTGGMHSGTQNNGTIITSKNMHTNGHAGLASHTVGSFTGSLPNGSSAGMVDNTNMSSNNSTNSGRKWSASTTSDHTAAYADQDNVCTATRTANGTGFGTESFRGRTTDADTAGTGEVPYRDRSRSPPGAVPMRRTGTGSNFSRLSPDREGSAPGTGSGTGDGSPSAGRSYHNRTKRSWDRSEYRSDRDRHESRGSRYRDEMNGSSHSRSSDYHQSHSHRNSHHISSSRARDARSAAHESSWRHSSSTGTSNSRRRIPQFSPPFEPPRLPRRRVLADGGGRHSPNAFD